MVQFEENIALREQLYKEVIQSIMIEIPDSVIRIHYKWKHTEVYLSHLFHHDKAILDTNGYVYGGITGIPVEDDFGAGTVNSHFEEGYDDDAEHNFTNLEYVYDGEGVQHPTIPRDIMTGFIEMDVNEISGITLGVLEDVGYYVNYGSQYCVYAVHLQFEN